MATKGEILKTYTIEINTEIAEAKKQVEDLRTSLKGKLGNNIATEIEASMEEAEASIDSLSQTVNKRIGEMNSALRGLNLDKLRAEMGELSDSVKASVAAVTEQVELLTTAFNSSDPARFEQFVARITAPLAELKIAVNEATDAIRDLDKTKFGTFDTSGFEKSGKQITRSAKQIEKDFAALKKQIEGRGGLTFDVEGLSKQELAEEAAMLSSLIALYNEANSIKKKIKDSGINPAVLLGSVGAGDINTITDYLEDVQKALGSASDKSKPLDLKMKLKISFDASKDIDQKAIDDYVKKVQKELIKKVQDAVDAEPVKLKFGWDIETDDKSKSGNTTDDILQNADKVLYKTLKIRMEGDETRLRNNLEAIVDKINGEIQGDPRFAIKVDILPNDIAKGSVLQKILDLGNVPAGTTSSAGKVTGEVTLSNTEGLAQESTLVEIRDLIANNNGGPSNKPGAPIASAREAAKNQDKNWNAAYSKVDAYRERGSREYSNLKYYSTVIEKEVLELNKTILYNKKRFAFFGDMEKALLSDARGSLKTKEGIANSRLYKEGLTTEGGTYSTFAKYSTKFNGQEVLLSEWQKYLSELTENELRELFKEMGKSAQARRKKAQENLKQSGIEYKYDKKEKKWVDISGDRALKGSNDGKETLEQLRAQHRDVVREYEEEAAQVEQYLEVLKERKSIAEELVKAADAGTDIESGELGAKQNRLKELTKTFKGDESAAKFDSLIKEQRDLIGRAEQTPETLHRIEEISKEIVFCFEDVGDILQVARDMIRVDANTGVSAIDAAIAENEAELKRRKNTARMASDEYIKRSKVVNPDTFAGISSIVRAAREKKTGHEYKGGFFSEAELKLFSNSEDKLLKYLDSPDEYQADLDKIARLSSRISDLERLIVYTPSNIKGKRGTVESGLTKTEASALGRWRRERKEAQLRVSTYNLANLAEGEAAPSWTKIRKDAEERIEKMSGKDFSLNTSLEGELLSRYKKIYGNFLGKSADEVEEMLLKMTPEEFGEFKSVITAANKEISKNGTESIDSKVQDYERRMLSKIQADLDMALKALKDEDASPAKKLEAARSIKSLKEELSYFKDPYAYVKNNPSLDKALLRYDGAKGKDGVGELLGAKQLFTQFLNENDIHYAGNGPLNIPIFRSNLEEAIDLANALGVKLSDKFSEMPEEYKNAFRKILEHDLTHLDEIKVQLPSGEKSFFKETNVNMMSAGSLAEAQEEFDKAYNYFRDTIVESLDESVVGLFFELEQELYDAAREKDAAYNRGSLGNTIEVKNEVKGAKNKLISVPEVYYTRHKLARSSFEGASTKADASIVKWAERLPEIEQKRSAAAEEATERAKEATRQEQAATKSIQDQIAEKEALIATEKEEIELLKNRQSVIDKAEESQSDYIASLKDGSGKADYAGLKQQRDRLQQELKAYQDDQEEALKGIPSLPAPKSNKALKSKTTQKDRANYYKNREAEIINSTQPLIKEVRDELDGVVNKMIEEENQYIIDLFSSADFRKTYYAGKDVSGYTKNDRGFDFDSIVSRIINSFDEEALFRAVEDGIVSESEAAIRASLYLMTKPGSRLKNEKLSNVVKGAGGFLEYRAAEAIDKKEETANIRLHETNIKVLEQDISSLKKASAFEKDRETIISKFGQDALQSAERIDALIASINLLKRASQEVAAIESAIKADEKREWPKNPSPEYTYNRTQNLERMKKALAEQKLVAENNQQNLLAMQQALVNEQERAKGFGLVISKKTGRAYSSNYAKRIGNAGLPAGNDESKYLTAEEQAGMNAMRKSVAEAVDEQKQKERKLEKEIDRLRWDSVTAQLEQNKAVQARAAMTEKEIQQLKDASKYAGMTQEQADAAHELAQFNAKTGKKPSGGQLWKQSYLQEAAKRVGLDINEKGYAYLKDFDREAWMKNPFAYKGNSYTDRIFEEYKPKDYQKAVDSGLALEVTQKAVLNAINSLKTEGIQTKSEVASAKGAKSSSPVPKGGKKSRAEIPQEIKDAQKVFRGKEYKSFADFDDAAKAAAKTALLSGRNVYVDNKTGRYRVAGSMAGKNGFMDSSKDLAKQLGIDLPDLDALRKAASEKAVETKASAEAVVVEANATETLAEQMIAAAKAKEDFAKANGLVLDTAAESTPKIEEEAKAAEELNEELQKMSKVDWSSISPEAQKKITDEFGEEVDVYKQAAKGKDGGANVNYRVVGRSKTGLVNEKGEVDRKTVKMVNRLTESKAAEKLAEQEAKRDSASEYSDRLDAKLKRYEDLLSRKAKGDESFNKEIALLEARILDNIDELAKSEYHDETLEFGALERFGAIQKNFGRNKDNYEYSQQQKTEAEAQRKATKEAEKQAREAERESKAAEKLAINTELSEEVRLLKEKAALERENKKLGLYEGNEAQIAANNNLIDELNTKLGETRQRINDLNKENKFDDLIAKNDRLKTNLDQGVANAGAKYAAKAVDDAKKKAQQDVEADAKAAINLRKGLAGKMPTYQDLVAKEARGPLTDVDNGVSEAEVLKGIELELKAVTQAKKEYELAKKRDAGTATQEELADLAKIGAWWKADGASVQEYRLNVDIAGDSLAELEESERNIDKAQDGALLKYLVSVKEEAEKLASRLEEIKTNGATAAYKAAAEAALEDVNKIRDAITGGDIGAVYTKWAGARQGAVNVLNSNDPHYKAIKDVQVSGLLSKAQQTRSTYLGMPTELLNGYDVVIGKLEEYKKNIENGLGSYSLFDFTETVAQLKSLDAALEASGRKTAGVFGVVSNRLTDMNAKFIAQYFSIQDWIRYLRTAISTVVELDTALTELRKVSNETDARLNQAMKTSAKTATSLGSTITDVVNATADWARLGYGIDQAEELARVSILYKNVGDNIDIDTASSSLISTMKGYQLEADQAESIVDKFNEIGNNFAINSAEIGEALKRSAASFNASGTSLDKSIALVTAANTVAQNAESVGTTFKTLSARIRGASTELADLGEEEDEYTKTTSKLRDLVKSLTKFDIMEADGKTYKDIYDILLGISKEWNNLSDVERASLGEALAGKRNANILYAVLQDTDLLEQVYAKSLASAGSAMREQENYQRSIQYSINQLKANGQSLAQDFLDTGLVKNVTSFLADTVGYLDQIVAKTGGLAPTVAAIMGASSIRGAGGLQNIYNGIRQGTLFDREVKTPIYNDAIDAQGRTVRTYTGQDEITKTGFFETTGGNLIKNLLISGAVTAAVAAITSWVKAVKEGEEATRESARSVREHETANRDYISSIEKLRGVLNDSNSSEDQRRSAQEKLLEIQNKLVSVYGAEAKQLDIINGDLDEQRQIINDLSKSEYLEWLSGYNKGGFLNIGHSTNEQNAARAYEKMSERQGHFLFRTEDPAILSILKNIDNVGLSGKSQIVSKPLTAKETEATINNILSALNEYQLNNKLSTEQKKEFEEIRAALAIPLQNAKDIISENEDPARAYAITELINLQNGSFEIVKAYEEAADDFVIALESGAATIDDYNDYVIARNQAFSLADSAVNNSMQWLKSVEALNDAAGYGILGNVDFKKRPHLKQADGSTETILSQGNQLFGQNGEGLALVVTPILESGEKIDADNYVDEIQSYLDEHDISVNAALQIDENGVVDESGNIIGGKRLIITSMSGSWDDRRVADELGEAFENGLIELKESELAAYDSMMANLDPETAQILSQILPIVSDIDNKVSGTNGYDRYVASKKEDDVLSQFERSGRLESLYNDPRIYSAGELKNGEVYSKGILDLVSEISAAFVEVGGSADDVYSKLIDWGYAISDDAKAVKKLSASMDMSGAIDAVDNVKTAFDGVKSAVEGLQNGKGLNNEGLKNIFDLFSSNTNSKFGPALSDYMSQLDGARDSAQNTQKILEAMLVDYVNSLESFAGATGKEYDYIANGLEEMGFKIITLDEDLKNHASDFEEVMDSIGEASSSVNQYTDEEIADLAALAYQLGLTTDAHKAYLVQKMVDAGVLDVSGDIAALQAVLNALGLAGEGWINYYRARANAQAIAESGILTGDAVVGSESYNKAMNVIEDYASTHFNSKTYSAMKNGRGGFKADAKGFAQTIYDSITTEQNYWYKHQMGLLNEAIAVEMPAGGSGVIGGGGSGGGGSSDNDKKKEMEWLERYLEAAQSARDVNQKLVDDERSSYDARIAANADLLAAQDEYIKRLTEAKELMEEEARTSEELIRQNLPELAETIISKVANGDVTKEGWKDEFSGLSEEQEKIVDDYIEYVDKAKDYTNQVIDEEEARFEQVQNEFELRLNKIKAEMKAIENEADIIQHSIDMRETTGSEIIKESDYEELIENANELADNYYEQLAVLEEQKATLDEGSAAWYNIVSEIYECESALRDVEKQQAEWNEQIKQLPIRRIQRYLQMLENIKKDIQNYNAEMQALGENPNQQSYTDLFELDVESLDKYREELNKLRENLKTYTYGTDKFEETANAIQECEDSVSSLIQEMREYNTEILNIPIEKINQVVEKLNAIKAAMEQVQEDNNTVTEAAIAILGQQADKLNKQIDEVNEKYDERRKILEDERDANKEQLALEKARLELEKARGQRTNKVLKNGEWTWMADQSAVQSAAETLRDAEYDKALADLEKAREEELEPLEDDLKRIEKLSEKWSEHRENSEVGLQTEKAIELTGAADFAERVLAGNDDAIFNKIQKSYDEMLHSIDQYDEQIKDYEQTSALMSTYISEYNRAIAEAEQIQDETARRKAMKEAADYYMKQMTAVQNMAKNGFTSQENLSATLGAYKETSAGAALANTVPAVQGLYSDFNSYMKIVSDQTLTLDKYTATWDAIHNDVQAQLEELKKLAEIEAQKLKERQAARAKRSSGDKDEGSSTSSGYRVVWRDGSSYTDKQYDSWEDLKEDGWVHHTGLDTGYIGGASDDEKLKALKTMASTDLKRDEVPALLQEGEVVLTRAQQDQLLKNLVPLGEDDMLSRFSLGADVLNLSAFKARGLKRNNYGNSGIQMQQNFTFGDIHVMEAQNVTDIAHGIMNGGLSQALAQQLYKK